MNWHVRKMLISAISHVSFNYLVGSHLQGRWHSQAERLGGLEVESKLEFRGLNNWQICGLFAFENPACIDSLLAMTIRCAGPVAHQTAGNCAFTIWAEHRKVMTYREFDNVIDPASEEIVGRDK